jgi:NAD(P)-dependent dehydrogenase (short-subunit alcohol dehydrogenase family)
MLPRTLAQAPGTQSLQGVFFWSAVLLIIVLVAFAGYTYLRKWMRADEPSVGRGFTLADVRELHRQGKMSDAEYEATKALLIGAAKKMASEMPPVLPRQPKPRPPADESI